MWQAILGLALLWTSSFPRPAAATVAAVRAAEEPGSAEPGSDRDEVFLRRSSRDLGRFPDPARPAAEIFSGQGDLKSQFCTLAPTSHLVSVAALPETLLAGYQPYLFASDDCVLAVNYGGNAAPLSFPLYGLTADFSVPPNAAGLTVEIDLTLPLYQPGPLLVQLEDRQLGEFVGIARLYPDAAGQIEEAFSPALDPAPYIDVDGIVSMRLLVEYNSLMPSYAESVDIDKLEIEPY